MEYVHSPYQPQETIAAIATPPGEGGVAIIRICGADALRVAEKIFSGPIRSYKSHTAHFGKILNAEGESIDEVLALVMLGPRSYTGEDTVEIHCHGGSLITHQVLHTALDAGARAAKPGEFTFRAFMNGKLDLSQAEAVQQLIHAKNTLAVQSAKQQLQGRLSQRVASFQKQLVDIAAVLEAWVDFPEEGLEFMSMEEVLTTLSQILSQMRHLSSTFHDGKMISHGIALCLIGPPNAGKSSLMNALLGKSHAIVTEIAGTTRDVLEADMKWGNLHFRLLDTAGIRHTEEIIEQEGIRRSKETMLQADLILFVLDASLTISEEIEQLIASLPKEKTVFVWNKIDLETPKPHAFLHSVCISAKELWGLDELKAKINEMVWLKGAPSKEEIVITSSRHHLSLTESCKALEMVIHSLKTGISAEFVSSDMRATLNALGQIIGTNITEDILSSIFSKFCVGK